MGLRDAIFAHIQRQEHDERKLRDSVDDADYPAQQHFRFAPHYGKPLEEFLELVASGSARGCEFVVGGAAVHPEREHGSDYGKDQRRPESREHSEVVVGIDAPVGAKHVEPPGKHEPEPALGRAQRVLFHPIGNPHHKGIGKQRIAEALHGVGGKQHRIVHLRHTDARKTGHARHIQQEAGKHRALHSESLGHDAGKPRGHGYRDAVNGKDVGRIVAAVGNVLAEPGLLHAVAHHKDKHAQKAPEQLFRQPRTSKEVCHISQMRRLEIFIEDLVQLGPVHVSDYHIELGKLEAELDLAVGIFLDAGVAFLEMHTPLSLALELAADLGIVLIPHFPAQAVRKEFIEGLELGKLHRQVDVGIAVLEVDEGLIGGSLTPLGKGVLKRSERQERQKQYQKTFHFELNCVNVAFI